MAILRFLGDVAPAADKPQTNLQLVQDICGLAITRPTTRDEIYCQVRREPTKIMRGVSTISNLHSLPSKPSL